MDVKLELHCRGDAENVGRGWKFDREKLPDAAALLMRCNTGKWRGKRHWEVMVLATDRRDGVQFTVTGVQWTNEQRKWFERHMKKLMEGEKL